MESWCKRLTNLTNIAKSQPHAAYAAYTHGEQHKYSYFMQTILDIEENLKPLDEILEDKFIPALFGREITRNERELVALPVKEGGLGIREISKESSRTYTISRSITAPLIKQIVEQSDFVPDFVDVKLAKSTTSERTKELNKQHIKSVKDKQSHEMKRTIEQISEPGASSWLGALPIPQYGIDMNKGEFNDALCLRYNKPLKNLPTVCPCGKKFNTTHALNCHLGGFVNARHDNIRDFEAQLLKTVCNDVQIEPPLQSVPPRVTLNPDANTKEDARLDVRARGYWRDGQNAYFDVCVTNADCESQRNTSLKQVLRKHDLKKKSQYNQRVMQIEHGTLTPLIFTTTGAMSRDCLKYHKSLAEKISEKKGDRYEEVMRYIRTKISFLAVKATLLCLRGSRSIRKAELGEDFGLSLLELGM